MVKYFPMAKSIARRFIGPVDVLEGAALDGLLDAARRYDGRVPFMNFAYRRIAGAVQDSQREGTHDYPAELVELDEEHHGTYEMHGLGFDLKPVMRVVPVQRPTGWMCPGPTGGLLSIQHAVTPREFSVLQMLFVLDMTQAEIARKIKRSECGVSQTRRQAFARIKANLAARGITRLEQIL